MTDARREALLQALEAVKKKGNPVLEASLLAALRGMESSFNPYDHIPMHPEVREWLDPE